MVYKCQNNYTRSMSTIGQNIKRYRKNLGLKQDELAHAIGRSHGQIKHWETDRHQPDLESIIVMAKFFKTSTDDLIGFQNDEKDELLALLLSDIKRAYEELEDGRQQGKFARQVSLYAEMLRKNKDIL